MHSLLVLYVFILIFYVSAQSGNVRQDYEIVECFRNQSDCNNRANGVMLPAGECCNSSFSATAFIVGEDSFGLATCLGCIKVEFNQRSFEFGQEDTGKTYTIMVDATYTASGSGAIQTPITIMAENFFGNVGDYLTRGIAPKTTTSLPYSFEIQINTIGNQLALEDDLLFNFTMSASQAPSVFLVLGRTQVRVADLDVVWVELKPQLVPEPSEGSGLSVTITRRAIGIAMPFGVTVTTIPITPRFDSFCTGDDCIATALSTDFVIGETFTRAISDQINEVTMEFTLKTDNVVELDEVFNVTLTVSDDRVIIRGESTKTVQFTSPQTFNIGLKKTGLVIAEGESIELEIQEFGDFIGGEVVGGLPGLLLNQSARIINELIVSSSPAIVGTDFIFNETIQSFQYGSDNRLQSVAFHPVHSIEDNLLEGDENIRIKLLTNRPIPMQIENSSVQTATVTIKDTTIGSITLEKNDYLFLETQGIIQVCAVIHDAFPSMSITVPYVVTENTAKEGLNDDYRQSNEEAFIFQPLQNRTCVRFLIINDEIAEPFHEYFTISLMSNINPPEITSNVNISTIEGKITIQDDDGISVRFENVSYTFIENGGDQLIYLLIEGKELSTSESVEVFITEPGNSTRLLGSVLFSSSTRRAFIVFPVMEDTFALDRISQLSLKTTTGGFITEGLPKTANVTVLDDDGDVTVNFVQSSYSYSEDNGTVSNIQLRLSNGIARDLSVDVTGGPGASQPFVIISGRSVTTTTVTFTAGGALTQDFPSFDILNDDIGLENIERYNLSLSNPSITEDVHLGPDTTISIIDDDYVTVSFVQSLYSYSEDHGTVSDIQLMLSNEIARDLSVNVIGGPRHHRVIHESGVNVNTTVTFIANGSMIQDVSSFNIVDDQTGLEFTERYYLGLFNSSITSNVILGRTTISIRDNDVVTVNFVKTLYEYNENDGDVGDIQVQLNRMIARELLVNVSGNTRSQQYVVQSGFDVFDELAFGPFSNITTLGLPIYGITDDNIGLEDVESYNISLSSNSDLVIHGDNASIRITDDDVPELYFTEPSYSFIESEGLSHKITVVLSKPVVRQVIAQVYGEPVDQSGVNNSGSLINQTVVFQPNDDSNSNLMRLVPVQINDDNVSNEPLQIYPVNFQNVPQGINVVQYNSTNVIIIDDDTSAVHFAVEFLTVSESVGSVNVTVILTGSTAVPVTVDVVLTNDSILLGTATFQPSSNPIQILSFIYSIDDDNIALEDDTVLVFKLGNATNLTIAEPNIMTLVIQDDDVLLANFSKPEYRFNENDGLVNIHVDLSHPIAQQFTVNTVNVGNTNQPFVHSSGPNFSVILTFPANTSSGQSLTISQSVNDDDFALENIETYEVQFSSPNPSQRVMLGEPTGIYIFDDEVVNIAFQDGNHFIEGLGAMSIEVNIDKPIYRLLSVMINSTYQPDQYVRQSGSSFSTQVVFMPQGQTTGFFNFPINNDDTALENTEREVLSFTGANSSLLESDRAILGPNVVVTIEDDDVVDFKFIDDTLEVPENSGSVAIRIRRDNPILRSVNITVIGMLISGHPYIDIEHSGSSLNRVITFPADDSHQDVFSFNYTIKDDTLGLEPVEIYSFNLNRSVPFTSVNLNSHNLMIEIIDDDYVPIIDNVYITPTFDMSMITLTCYADGATTYKWTDVLAGEVVSNTSIYTTSYGIINAGYCHCTASNRAGSKTANINGINSVACE